MNKRYVIIFLRSLAVSILFCLTKPAAGQNADEVLKNVSNQLESFESIYIEMDMHLDDDRLEEFQLKGKCQLWIKEGMFKLITDNWHIYCDTINVWTFGIEENQCEVKDYHDFMKKQGINFSNIFSFWNSDSYTKELTETSDSLTQVMILTNNKEINFQSVELFINEMSNQIEKIVIGLEKGYEIIYRITALKPIPELSVYDFRFNAADYPAFRN